MQWLEMTSASELETALAEACAKYKIGEDDSFLVRSLLERDERRWPGCCGSGCEPCMNDICDAALMIKKRLAKRE